ncbi:MAG: threonine-phosphate decarboxylase CobD [Beijerinckiaceae bacterium]
MKHGGDLTAAMARYGGNDTAWLDLSTGINPHAYPLRETPEHVWMALPTRAAHDALICAARVAYTVPDGVEVVAAPGTQSLIQWLPIVLGKASVAIVSPTYNEHALAWRRSGATVIESSLHDPYPAAARHLVIVNPNNPDGHVFDHALLRGFAEQAVRRGGTVILDESFIDTMPDVSAAALCRDYPVVIMRSFGKFYGLAGLRLGFLLAGEVIARRVAEALGPWAVAGPALCLGTTALLDRDWAHRMRLQLADEAAALDATLAGAGLTLKGGTSLYRLAAHPGARRVHDQLAARRIWIRCFDWDETLLRIGLPATKSDFVRFENALEEITGKAAHVRDHGSMTG